MWGVSGFEFRGKGSGDSGCWFRVSGCWVRCSDQLRRAVSELEATRVLRRLISPQEPVYFYVGLVIYFGITLYSYMHVQLGRRRSRAGGNSRAEPPHLPTGTCTRISVWLNVLVSRWIVTSTYNRVGAVPKLGAPHRNLYTYFGVVKYLGVTLDSYTYVQLGRRRFRAGGNSRAAPPHLPTETCKTHLVLSNILMSRFVVTSTYNWVGAVPELEAVGALRGLMSPQDSDTQ